MPSKRMPYPFTSTSPPLAIVPDDEPHACFQCATPTPSRLPLALGPPAPLLIAATPQRYPLALASSHHPRSPSSLKCHNRCPLPPPSAPYASPFPTDPLWLLGARLEIGIQNLSITLPCIGKARGGPSFHTPRPKHKQTKHLSL